MLKEIKNTNRFLSTISISTFTLSNKKAKPRKNDCYTGNIFPIKFTIPEKTDKNIKSGFQFLFQTAQCTDPRQRNEFI